MKNLIRRTVFFTMVELLIVISIILILTSILMPALRQAKAVTRQIYCGNNFRQMGTAMNVYAGDNGEFFPQVATGYMENIYGANHYIYFSDLLIPYINENAKVFGPLGYYWKNSPFICPEALRSYDTASYYGMYFTCTATLGGWTEAYNHGGVNYASNAPRYPKRISRISNPSRTALSGDSTSTLGVVGNFRTVTSSSEGGAYWYGNNLISNCHKNGLNWLFADSHVNWRKYAPTNSTGTDAEFNQDWQLNK